jgi:hypothetical protein
LHGFRVNAAWLGFPDLARQAFVWTSMDVWYVLADNRVINAKDLEGEDDVRDRPGTEAVSEVSPSR